MEERRAVIVDVSLDLLGQVLQLPDGVRIERVVEHLNRPGTVEVLLAGSGLPDKFIVGVGCLVAKVDPRLHRITPWLGRDVEWVWP